MTGADDRRRCAHLLRRFGLGSSEAEVDYYVADGLDGAIHKLLNYADVDEGFTIDVESFRNEKGRLPNQFVSNWWVARMIMTRRPLQERMTLFWHDHFATSGTKVNSGEEMYHQNDVFRKNCLGTFRTLISEVSKDPAMILWLDNQQNVKGHANENFAREVMELFTLGIGHYTEKDVQEGARAFTGWSLQRNGPKNTDFIFRSGRHDDGPKTYLGNQGNFNGDDILNILCDKPRTAEYITTKIWDWFVWPKPTPATVAPFIQKFRSSGLDIRALLEAIMKSDEFHSPQALRAIVKSPVDFCVSTLRQMGVGQQMSDTIKAQGATPTPRAAIAPAAIANQTMKAMGMWPLYPPDVHGWDNGKAWINSQTMISRVEWATRLFGKGGVGDMGPLKYQFYALLTEEKTPEALVHRVLALFDGTLQPEHRALLVKAATTASGGMITPENANQTASLVCRLMFGAPEFQMS